VQLHEAVAAAGRSKLGRRLDLEVGTAGPHTVDQLRAAAGGSDKATPVTTALLALREAGIVARRLFRSLGVAADIPIEPPGTTALLDELMEVPGVVAVGVPGAGGYDAVFVLATHDACTASVDAVFARHATARLDVSIRTTGMERGPRCYDEATMGYFATEPSSERKRGRAATSTSADERRGEAVADGERRLWLIKSEPNEYGWDHLVKEGTDIWDGVRNHRAANNLRAMKVGDLAFFYHSCVGLEIVGIVEVVEDGLLDPTDETNKWAAVRVKPVRRLERPVGLHEIKADPALADMELIRLSRLSVATVTPAHWEHIVRLAATPKKK
jgi:predicted RNA-binding protein with PUA-like domain